MMKIKQGRVLFLLLFLFIFCSLGVAWAEEREGLLREYYEDGVLHSEKNYRNDRLNGVSKIYYPNGKIQKLYRFEDNQLDGIQKEYYEKGQLKRQAAYKDGQLAADAIRLAVETAMDDKIFLL